MILRGRTRRVQRTQTPLETGDELIAEVGGGLACSAKDVEVYADVSKICEHKHECDQTYGNEMCSCDEDVLTIWLANARFDCLRHNHRRPRNNNQIPIRPNQLIIQMQL